MREHTRPTPDRSTAVTESQAAELTLTLTEAAVRPIQVWVRTSGAIDGTRTTVTASLGSADAALVAAGQRVRAFAPETRSRMYQAWITRVMPRGDRADVTATLTRRALEDSSHYILEIVTEPLEALSVPNEAIIESGGAHVVYVQDAPGRYAPREIRIGLQGELYTQILEGLAAGEQVVTFGSFFIDAEHKLKEF
ncbi:MAG: hypothetical protein HY657_00040 [Acidobacteria bacterium]|nr:hypothetical protein [Acidobacteriota bacterium]